MGRRTSLASLGGDPVETVPGQNDPVLVRLPLAKLIPTPLNPRTDFGGPDSLTELGESMRKRQLQPVVVIGRVSYLNLFPEHTEEVGAASHVIVTGERRYRGARQIGLPSVAAVILEEIATSRADVLDAVLSENIDRKNFDPIEEAVAVRTMVKECGTAVAAAARFRRTGGWVSQRLSLLRLAPEVQVLVRSGQVPVRDARVLASHPAHEQMPAWKAMIADRATARSAKQAPSAGAPEEALPAADDAVVVDIHSRTIAAPAPRAARPAPTGGDTPAVPVPPAVADAVSDGGLEYREGAPLLAEPEWAVGDTSEPVAVARALATRFAYEERRVIASYLLSIGDQEQKAASSASM